MEYIAILSLFISLVSLYVAMRLAWETKLAPAKLVAILTQILVLSKIGDEEGKEIMRTMIPSLQVRNIGAKIVLIENVRLTIYLSDDQSNMIYSYPESKLNVEMILSDKNQYHDSGRDSFPVNIDAMFRGFSLSSGESWVESYSYIALNEGFKKLSGKSQIDLEVKERNVGWRRIHTTTIDFGEAFIDIPNTKGFSMSICRSKEYID